MNLSQCSQHLSSFLFYLRYEKRYSPATLKAYEQDVRSFFFFVSKEQIEEYISTAHLRAWVVALRLSQKKAVSVHRKISALRTFFRYLQRKGHITFNPAQEIALPKKGKLLTHFLSVEQAGQLINAPQQTPEKNAFITRTHTLVLTLFYATGMRLSELVFLKEDSIDFSGQLIKITGKGNKERLLPISPHLSDLLRRFIAEKKERFPHASAPYLLLHPRLGTPLNTKYVYRCVHQYIGKISTQAKRTPHILRHTFATHLLNEGADINVIKTLLGHASLSSTQIYTHTHIERLKEVYHKSHPQFFQENREGRTRL